MVSDINIKKSKKASSKIRTKRVGPRRPALFSRLARIIFYSNLVGLLVLVAGAMAMGRFSKGLIQAKIENLTSQTEMITTIMGDTASGIGLSAELDVVNARDVLSRINLPDNWRVRLYDKTGILIADSDQLDTDIAISQLDPIIEDIPEPTWQEVWRERLITGAQDVVHDLPWRVKHRNALRQDLKTDIRKALLGDVVAGQRYNQEDELIVSVSQPVTRVQQVLGVVTLESSDVESIVNGERQALAPIIGLALLAGLLSSLALTLFIAIPIRKLARAAEIVTRSSQRRDAIPDLSRRHDEIGDLSVVMREMASGLYSRIDDIANFAADVAHEIKNPLTSLRSASDSLRYAKTSEQREQLIDIVQNDVARMDRLISDISKASKVDANLARETAETIDVSEILAGLTAFYQQTRLEDAHTQTTRDGEEQGAEPPDIRFIRGETMEGEVLYIRAFETPFAQVLRNLIDNALTFSPSGGEVLLTLNMQTGEKQDRVIITVDDSGPGIPTENLETVFERFYTERPKGAQFGSHSGLGLAICRQIMAAHRGYIHAENRLNPQGEIMGARFVLNLPRQMPRTTPRRKRDK